MNDTSKLHRLELKVPPPVIALLCAIGVYLSVYIIDWRIQVPYKLVVFALLVFIGLSLALIGVTQFRYASTTIHPQNPDHTNNLVTQGVYRYSRNPMYLGMLLVLIGWTVYIGNTVAVIFPVVFFWYITRFQILPEERILTAKFGSELTNYMQRVRRWL